MNFSNPTGTSEYNVAFSANRKQAAAAPETKKNIPVKQSKVDTAVTSGGTSNRSLGKQALAYAATIIKKKTPNALTEVFSEVAESQVNQAIVSAIASELKTSAMQTRILDAISNINGPPTTKPGKGVYMLSKKDPEISINAKMDITLQFNALGRPRTLTLHDFPVSMTLSPTAGPDYKKNYVSAGTNTTSALIISSTTDVKAVGKIIADYDGDGVQDIYLTPTSISSNGALMDRHIIIVSNGDNVSAAVDATGRVITWGKRNDTVGYQGINYNSTSTLPVDISSFGSINGKVIIDVKCGVNHVIALDSEGKVHGWGQKMCGRRLYRYNAACTCGHFWR